MNTEQVEEVSKKIYQTLSGQGILPVNKDISKMVNMLYYEHGYYHNDLVIEILTYIIQQNLMHKYDKDKSLGMYVTSIVYYALKNLLRKRGGSKFVGEVSMDPELLEWMMSEADYDIEHTSIHVPSPEQCYFSKEIVGIIRSHFNEVELSYCEGGMTSRQAAAAENTTPEAFRKRIERKKVLLRKQLLMSGYKKTLSQPT